MTENEKPTLEGLKKWAHEIAKQNDFQIGELIFAGHYYTKNHPRDVVYEGTYKDKAAVLKAYKDPVLRTNPLP